MKLQNKETTLVIKNKIANRRNKVTKLESEIIDLERKFYTTSDKNQKYIEAEEEVLISGRPKKYETKLVGRLHWKQEFKDENTGEVVTIDRKTVVKVNGEWKI